MFHAFGQVGSAKLTTCLLSGKLVVHTVDQAHLNHREAKERGRTDGWKLSASAPAVVNPYGVDFTTVSLALNVPLYRESPKASNILRNSPHLVYTKGYHKDGYKKD